MSGTPAPLAGVRVVVTRPRGQASRLVELLADHGAEVVRFPTIRIDPPLDPEPLRRAAREAAGFDWVVFTSVNAVDRFVETLEAVHGDADALTAVRVCAIGDATAAELARRRVDTHLVPDEFVTEGVVEALLRADPLAGRRVLLPRAAGARDLLPRALREAGSEVVEVAAYRTVRDGEGADAIRDLLAADAVDLITFTSGSTVRAFLELVGGTGRARIASIGPATSAVARELGIRVTVEAEVHTVEGLVASIVETQKRQGS